MTFINYSYSQLQALPMETQRTALMPKNRIISESTGLYKLQLSPQNRKTPPSPTKSTRGLHVAVPIVKQKQETAPDRNEILRKYASKQAKLMELEKSAELVRFEILELQAQLETELNSDRPDAPFLQEDIARLKKKVSSIFQSPKKEQANRDLPQQPPLDFPEFAPQNNMHIASHNEKQGLVSLTKTQSDFFPPPKMASMHQQLKKKTSGMFPDHEQLKKKASKIFPDQNQLKQKASMMFNNKFMTEVKGKMDQQQAEIDKFTEKSFGFARNFITSLSPKKEKSPLVESSFMFDNVAPETSINKSILLSEDESETSVLHFHEDSIIDRSIVDIDDYSSEEE
ncbi:hypothetical protein FOB63_001498 [Clavispora lusitaniae]|nr:hypothetical protein FOB63_001498 [Clavispora lusitaniae]